MSDIRKPAVANLFYPEDKVNLRRLVNNYISEVPSEVPEYFIKQNVDNLLGIIVPHAGYKYSGAVAGYGFSLLKQKEVDTVIMIGPSHYNDFQGYALTRFSAFDTPFGSVPVNAEFASQLMAEDEAPFHYLDTAHIREHSLEVQLPFLQISLVNDFKIVPILMGRQTVENIVEGMKTMAKVLKRWEKNYIIVISSDLSHYYSDQTAREMDGKFIEIMESFEPRKLIQHVSKKDIEACGAGPVACLLELGKKLKRTNIKNLIYRNSGDVSGNTDRVVGYLSAAVW